MHFSKSAWFSLRLNRFSHQWSLEVHLIFFSCFVYLNLCINAFNQFIQLGLVTTYCLPKFGFQFLNLGEEILFFSASDSQILN